MNTFLKKMAMVFVGSIFLSTGADTVQKVEPTETIDETVETNIEEELEETLEEENLELTDSELDVAEDTYSFTVETEDGEIVEIEIPLDSSEVTAVVESEDGKQDKYSISMPENVITEEAENLELMIEDTETGEVYDTDDIEGQFSSMNVALPVALAIPWGIPIVWSALVSLFKVGAVIIAAGATYVVGTQAISRIKKSKNPKKWYTAHLKDNKLYIGKGLTEAKAVSWLKSKQSTYSLVRANAKKVASKLAKGSPIHEVGRRNGKPIKGQYYHYHSSTRKPTGHHAFYGSAVK